MVLY
jgi:hypothetical protein